MTDKQIIIDGVDVAECQYLYFAIEDSIIDYKEYPRCSIGEAFTNNACKNSNCYYKQLQRAEQQLAKDEEIQVDMRLKIDEINGLIKRKEQKCDQLKAENEMLKEYIEREEESTLKQCPCCGESILSKQGKKLYKALKDINDLAFQLQNTNDEQDISDISWKILNISAEAVEECV